jgi:hypothetical protein
MAGSFEPADRLRTKNQELLILNRLVLRVRLT